MLLENIGDNTQRWRDAVGVIDRLSPDTRRRAIALLAQLANEIRKHPNSSELWQALRAQLNRHRSHPDAQWAMPTADLESLEAIYQELTPEDPAVAYAWIFDWSPDLPGGKSYDLVKDGTDVEAARQRAITATYQNGGAGSVLSIAAYATQPAAVGRAFAISVENKLALALALEHSGSENPNYREMTLGILSALFQESGWPILDAAIARLKATNCEPKAVARVYLVGPPSQDTWQRLSAETPAIQRRYWAELNPWMVPEKDTNHLFVAEQLLAVQRSATVAEWTSFSQADPEVVIRTLEQLPADLEATAEPRLVTTDILYHIVNLLEQLDQSDAVGDDTIARLELPFISELPHWGRPNLATYREIAKAPPLFADLIASTYKRGDGQPDPMTDPHQSHIATKIVTPIIFGNGEIPAKLHDGSVDYEALSIWVDEARRLCVDRGRGDIGDKYIGSLLAKAPTGADGIWPCEPVRELLEHIGSPDIGEGFVTGKINLANATGSPDFNGSTQYHTLANSYRLDAAAIGARWPYNADLLRSLAQWYQQTATWHDTEADERDQFES